MAFSVKSGRARKIHAQCCQIDDNSKIHVFPIFNLEVDIAQQGIRMISGPGLPVLFYSSHSCLVARLRVYHCGAELTSPSL